MRVSGSENLHFPACYVNQIAMYRRLEIDGLPGGAERPTAARTQMQKAGEFLRYAILERIVTLGSTLPHAFGEAVQCR